MSSSGSGTEEGGAQNIAVVFCERLDQYKIDGRWLKIPIMGVFDVDITAGTILRWKDHFCYAKYQKQKEALFGANFSLFRKTAPPSSLETRYADDQASDTATMRRKKILTLALRQCQGKWKEKSEAGRAAALLLGVDLS